MFMVPPPKQDISQDLERRGYHFLSEDEIRGLIGTARPCDPAAKRALQAYAEGCGARIELAPNGKSARLLAREPGALQ
jgi:hypothetical protein